MPSIFRKPVNINRGVYAMPMPDGQNAEITMYGQIVKQRPRDWWTDKVKEGDYIVQNEFMQDLESLSRAKSITIRMNSLGGDAGVSILIHNRLRELAAKGTALTCVVDGVAMSGGSLIMAACDTVKVNPSSLIMIHRCWSTLWGGYNADELREEAAACEAWDRAQASIYTRKSGLSEDEVTHMMSETTYMTGQEAIEMGFANALIEDAEPLEIAASADGRSLFVRGKELHLCTGMFAPDDIPTAGPGTKVSAENTPQAEALEEGGNHMTENTETAQIQEPVNAAEEVAAERRRLKDLDTIAGLYDPELVYEAQYGDNPCTAQELAYRAAVESATKAAGEGKAFLAAMYDDAKAVPAVGAAPAAESEELPGEMTGEQRMAAARRDVRALLGKEK